MAGCRRVGSRRAAEPRSALNGRSTPMRQDRSPHGALIRGRIAMLRFVLPAVLAISLTGCGAMSYSLTANLPGSGTPTGKAPRLKAAEASTDFKTKVAAATADDKAPKGSYEKAPSGAL